MKALVNLILLLYILNDGRGLLGSALTKDDGEHRAIIIFFVVASYATILALFWYVGTFDPFLNLVFS